MIHGQARGVADARMGYARRMWSARRVPRSLAALAVVGALPSCGPTFATSEQLWSEALARLDLDGDGVVTQEEYEVCAGAGDRFEDIDTSGDGRVSVSELYQFTVSHEPRTRGGQGARAP